MREKPRELQHQLIYLCTKRKVEIFLEFKEKFLELIKVKSTMADLKYGIFLGMVSSYFAQH